MHSNNLQHYETSVRDDIETDTSWIEIYRFEQQFESVPASVRDRRDRRNTSSAFHVRRRYVGEQAIQSENRQREYSNSPKSDRIRSQSPD